MAKVGVDVDWQGGSSQWRAHMSISRDQMLHDPGLWELLFQSGMRGLYTATHETRDKGVAAGRSRAAVIVVHKTHTKMAHLQFHLHGCGADPCDHIHAGVPICFSSLQRVPDRMLCHGQYKACRIAQIQHKLL
eukprot:gene6908-8243_t